MMLPQYIFFTGVPGSRWSAVAQTLEQHPSFNVTDRTDLRTYTHGSFSGHVGAYFGKGMEFDTTFDKDVIDSAWEKNSVGTKLVKSHDWAYMLFGLKAAFPKDWIMLVHRPSSASFDWWKAAGGFNITYPKYDSYIDDINMRLEIAKQNDEILKFAKAHEANWHQFTSQWVEDNFGFSPTTNFPHCDIFVTIIK